MSDLIFDIGLLAISFSFCLFMGIVIYKDSKAHKKLIINFNKQIDKLIDEIPGIPKKKEKKSKGKQNIITQEVKQELLWKAIFYHENISVMKFIVESLNIDFSYLRYKVLPFVNYSKKDKVRLYLEKNISECRNKEIVEEIKILEDKIRVLKER